MPNKFFAKGELKDDKIIAALKRAANDYENGEIAEVHDLLLEIAAAIEEWEAIYHAENGKTDFRQRPA